LSGDLITEDTSDLLQVGELGATRKAAGVNLSAKFAGNLPQSSL
jgi:hypothetical protein